MSRIVVSALSIVFLLGICTQFAAAQGPIRKIATELQLQKADYPGPISYAPSDQDTRSKRLRMQTGHYGLFYNCDSEECKRNSPYICWNSQHKADWYCGWKAALRKDKQDVKQRLFDGSCKSCDCQECAGGQVQGVVAPQYGQAPAAKATEKTQQSLVAKVRQLSPEVAVQQQQGRPVINAAALGRKPVEVDQTKTAPQRQAKRQGLFRIR